MTFQYHNPIPMPLLSYGSCPSPDYVNRSPASENFGEFTPEEMHRMIALPGDLERYGTIFLGYPNWRRTCPCRSIRSWRA